MGLQIQNLGMTMLFLGFFVRYRNRILGVRLGLANIFAEDP